VTGQAPDTAAKNTYTQGFLAGLERTFAENVAPYALALVKDEVGVTYHKAMDLTDLRSSSFTVAENDQAAWQTGFRDGRRAGADKKKEPLAAKPASLAE